MNHHFTTENLRHSLIITARQPLAGRLADDDDDS
jgi:hypothetical protein